jgi:hypothetical protein
MNESAGKDKALPTRIKLLNWGVNESTEGPVIVDERTLAIFSAMQKKIGRDRAPLDFEHNTVPGTPEYQRTSEPRVIAGMGTPVVIQGEGLFLESLSYTSTGETSARDYEDVSAAPLLNKDRVVVGLHSAALTRTGAVYGAHFAAEDVLKLAGEGITLAAFSSHLNLNLNPDLTLPSPEQTKTLTPDKNMADQVTLESLSAQLRELAPTLTKLGERLTALEAAKPAVVDITPLAARITALEVAGTASATAALEAERAKIVPLFAAEGKSPINPATKKAYTAEELKALDLPTLQVLHANTPVTVALRARTQTASTEGKTDLKGLAKAMAAHKAECGQ